MYVCVCGWVRVSIYIYIYLERKGRQKKCLGKCRN